VPQKLPFGPPADPPAAGSKPRADSLVDFLAALNGPLSFIAHASSAAAARTVFPAAKMAERGRALLATLRDPRAREQLEALCVGLVEYESTPSATRPAQAQRLLGLVEVLAKPPAVAPPPYHRTSSAPQDDLASLAQRAQYAHGVGPRRSDQFKKLGIETIEDLLYHLPFRYEDRRTISSIRSLRVGEVASVVGEIVHLAERYVGRMQKRILEAVLKDDSGLLALTWFHQIAYFKNRYQIGQRCLVHGKVEGLGGAQKRMVHPEVDTSSELDGQGILPVYNKPTTTSVGVMRSVVHQTVRDFSDRLPSALPDLVVSAAGVADLRQAMQLLHFPAADADIEQLNAFRSLAHRSLVFDELFFLQLGMALRRRAVELEPGRALPERGTLTGRLRALLPFQLTGAQERVVREILADMARPQPLHRLVQGDVGSGKTMVALLAALVAIENEHQVAFMAPTELLAEQHFATIEPLASQLGIETVLLTGARTKSQRRAVYERIASGEVQLAVGTHALIQEGVRFKRIGLGVIDEQHRFGVLQRAALRRLGGDAEVSPDILLMTATPIPRTLAMTVYGDLDVSVIDEMPPGRQPVRTLLRNEGERAKVYDLVKRELDRGHQAYVVYPLVESSEDSDLRDATTMAQELARGIFPEYRVGLVHGRMKPAEKDAVMRRFKAGDVQLLVSTTVIEVGIDVPNATVMVVEHAEHFGLSQLHQLRGRVGRGSAAALCILLAPFHRGDDTRRRLEAMASTTDGFKIAEVDLEIRGPGELLGTRQSGLPDFRVANLIRDRGLMEEARRAADAWLQRDPNLESPESKLLRVVLAHRWAGRLELAQIG
jgi:ATP-dependent DNA helicase RecG